MPGNSFRDRLVWSPTLTFADTSLALTLARSLSPARASALVNVVKGTANKCFGVLGSPAIASEITLLRLGRDAHRSKEHYPPTTAVAARRVTQWAKLAVIATFNGLTDTNLNFGNCFAYALAKDKSAPLLFKGADFGRTDVMVALY